METEQHRDRQVLIKYVHLLRYGQSASQSPRRVFLSLKHIAKTVKVAIQQVRVLLKQDPAKPDHRKVVIRGPRSLLSAQHLEYLTSPLILQKWACKSLAERVVLFHRRFGEAKIFP
jgi:hypothetical protein